MIRTLAAAAPPLPFPHAMTAATSPKIPGLKSPYDSARGLVYFPRMISKIRLHQAGKLPADYIANLGEGFDGRCVRLLGVDYEALRDRVVELGEAARAEGCAVDIGLGSDEELLNWCVGQGRPGRPLKEEEIEVWNGFMIKRGWRDGSNGVLRRRLKEAGASEDCGIETMFDFIDFDEGRSMHQH